MDITYHIWQKNICTLIIFSSLQILYVQCTKCLLSLNRLPLLLFHFPQSRESWNLYFAFLSVFNIFGLIIFFIFGSGELQEWAAPKMTDEPKNKNTVPMDDL